MKFLIHLFLALIFFNDYSGYSQNKLDDFSNLPRITHYSKKDFQADVQFWTMTQDNEGISYFGNNDGVLIFDGERWEKITLPNNSSVRSLTTTKEGLVYAGGFNELGIITKDSLGKYRYKSLLEKLELDEEKLENLWQVHEFKDHIIYRSFGQLITISGNSATQISSNLSFTFSGVANNTFFVQDANHGIFSFDPDSMRLSLVFDQKLIDNSEIIGFLPGEQAGEVILVAKNGNLYKSNPEKREIELWRKVFENGNTDQVISSRKFGENYLLGTLSSGIIMVTSGGEVVPESPLFSELSNSSVLNLFSNGQNVWALLNNGLDFVEFTSPVSHLFSEASIYDILLDGEQIYLATNKGVYYSNLSLSGENNYKFTFTKIPNFEGQAWSVQKEKGSVIIGHDKGLFELDSGLAHKIGDVDGFWKILPIPEKDNAYLACNYSGLYLLTRSGNEWNLGGKISGFDESTRDILKAEEKSTYWVCHGYKGVYKVKFTEDYSRVYAVDHFTDQNGLSSPFNVNVTKWKDDIVFTTNTGVYEFQKKANRFEPYKPLNSILDTAYNTRKLLMGEKRAWFVQDDEIGYFNPDEDQPKIYKNLFLNLKGNLNRGMESIYPLPDEKVLIGATTGLYWFNIASALPNYKVPTKLNSISIVEGENRIFLPLNTAEEIQLPIESDIVRFEFSAPEMSPASTVQYQYILEGIDKKWSAWEDTPFKEYTHLRPGDYIFKVRSRDLSGMEGDIISYKFNVPRVWYQTTLAILVYILGFIALCFLLVFLIRRKIHQERLKAKLASEKTQKLLQLEIEQLKLKQEKENIRKDKQLLEEDNIRKSKELANYTMMLVQKKDIFSETYQSLQEFRKSLKTQMARKNLQDILHKLHQHRIGEEYMNVFDVHFEKVHKDFFKRLKEIDPKLTKRELRLCAFVKMNLTNKEIAPLLNISVRGVETARYRIRKKLDVQETNFLEFLEKLSEPAVETVK
ncbi:triple tyrosine motif-containing protein [Zunongwangia sp. F363]|uniref:Triple tyrosine motif-containing protein n=1 Tax=Autumnicola tepida TaxID=3075595 RepID=A0ABU3C933_9FLAO|nr:triple tyrosine motif-containing protein [Zunongwangia sp. F363]MDT0642778.1 triple tyrosine motif-containing protein [Zunongwangia sp. F363]